jgi:hypothetical protein
VLIFFITKEKKESKKQIRKKLLKKEKKNPLLKSKSLALIEQLPVPNTVRYKFGLLISCAILNVVTTFNLYSLLNLIKKKIPPILN